MAYEQILYEVADPVATITMNRPEALNAWTNTMGAELADAFGRADRDPAVVGIVLTGAGRGFCAGADMNLLGDLVAGGGAGDGGDGDGDPSAADALIAAPNVGNPSAPGDIRGAHTYPMSLDKPVIGAITGAVAGMGLPIALACDLRFMSDDAVITTSFSQRGLIAEWGLSWLLPRLVGPAHALDLLFSSRKVRGPEAERIGLVNRSMPADEVLMSAQDYIVELAATASPTSLAVMKRQVYAQLHAGLAEAHADAVQRMIASFGRPDFKEGVNSYLERRPPRFARLGTAD